MATWPPLLALSWLVVIEGNQILEGLEQAGGADGNLVSHLISHGQCEVCISKTKVPSWYISLYFVQETCGTHVYVCGSASPIFHPDLRKATPPRLIPLHLPQVVEIAEATC